MLLVDCGEKSIIKTGEDTFYRSYTSLLPESAEDTKLELSNCLKNIYKNKFFKVSKSLIFTSRIIDTYIL